MLSVTRQCRTVLWFWLHKIPLVLIAADQLYSLRREELRLKKKSNWHTSECCNKFRLMLMAVALGNISTFARLMSSLLSTCTIQQQYKMFSSGSSSYWYISCTFSIFKMKFISTCILHNKNLHLSRPAEIVTCFY